MKALTIPLYNRQQARQALTAQVFPYLDAALQGSRRWVLSIKPEKRSNPQNRRYWGQGVLAQVAAQAVVNGKQYSAETFHEMFKRMFIGVEELPNGQVIGKSSTKLTTSEFCDFCQQVEAYAANELGVVFFDLPKE
jgi:hypothetical protein